MGARHVFLLAVLATVAVASLTVDAQESAVKKLTKDNFDSTLEENDLVLVKFYAPWCGHCKQMAPHYEAAANKLKEKGSKVVLAKVDATEEGELADKHQVRGYPTLKFFRKATAVEYNGGRTEEKIVEWVESMTGPALIEIEGDYEAKLKEDESKVAFVGEFKSKEGDVYKMYEAAAETNRQQAKFYVSTSDSHSDRIFVKREEEEIVVFEGKTKEELAKFITDEWFPLFGAINGDNFKHYADRGLDIVWFCGEKSHFDGAKEAVREVSKNLRSEYSFVWLDTEQFKSHAEGALGITEFPGLVYQSKKGRYVFPTKVAEADSKTLGSFFDDVKGGKIEKSIKSEPIPETNDEPVKVVVAKQFEEMVLQKDKDVMLEVYAPWCGHCKSFEPVYKEFAEKMKNVEHIVVAKMDGTANESSHEEFEWAGFPTIFFVKAGTTTPMKYESGRTIEDLMKFVKENSSKPIDLEGGDEKEEL